MKRILLTLFLFIFFTATQNASASNIYEVTIDGIITSSTAEIIKASIEKTAKDNGSVLLIKLNTPGGTLDSTREIVKSILSSSVPITVYVSPSGSRAASAGSFILLAGDYAIMDDGTNVGAAHPVDITGSNIEGDMREKVQSDTTAFMRSIAEKRSRALEPALLMVTKSESYTASEALKNKIIDDVVTQDKNYAEMIKARFSLESSAQIIPIEFTFLQNVRNALADPNLLVALLFLGIIMIALEFKIPGTFVFLGIGMVSLILFAVGANIIPVNFFALLLIVVGIALLIIEIFVVSFGLLTVGGVVSMVLGLTMLFDGSASMGIAVSYWLIFIIVAVVVLLAVLVGRLIIKDYKKRSVVGVEALIGKDADVMEFKNNKGSVYLHGEIWSAVSDDDLKKDDLVTVISRDNFTLKVAKKQ